MSLTWVWVNVVLKKDNNPSGYIYKAQFDIVCHWESELCLWGCVSVCCGLARRAAAFLQGVCQLPEETSGLLFQTLPTETRCSRLLPLTFLILSLITDCVKGKSVVPNLALVLPWKGLIPTVSVRSINPGVWSSLNSSWPVSAFDSSRTKSNKLAEPSPSGSGLNQLVWLCPRTDQKCLRSQLLGLSWKVLTCSWETERNSF